MKILSLVTALFVTSLALADGGGFKLPPAFTLLDCVSDARAADGPYRELVIHRVGNGPFEVVTYESYVPEGGAYPSAVRRSVIAASVGCYKAYVGTLPVRCFGDKFELSLEETKSGYEAKWSNGGAFTFGRDSSFPSSCKLLH